MVYLVTQVFLASLALAVYLASAVYQVGLVILATQASQDGLVIQATLV